jgi:7-cyano-7-deazaguanine reductase
MHRLACVHCTPEKELKALGGSTIYTFDGPQPNILERFASPIQQTSGFGGHISIKCPEFTSLCPKTGQPDFATIVLDYQPNRWCVESKSLKLYLMGFRNHGSFHEDCVQRICTDLAVLLEPAWIQIQGQFAPRGGISFWPSVTWSKPK